MTAPKTICAWCPGFSRKAARHSGVSHGICPSCRATLEGQTSLFLLHVTYPATGYVQTLTFPDAFSRALHMILLAGQPVTLRIQGPLAPVVEVALVPVNGAAGPVVDVALEPKD